ncbi:MAG: amidohydrolase family protein, partial [Dehalococcoidia bacterium]|nr:amidohydrolase family protein [Dehalococcoidia bacterium]
MRKPGPRGMSPEKILSIINVALGKEKADLVLTNAKLVNVYTGEIQPDYCVAVKHDRIAYVGKNASHTIGPDTRVLDIPGKTIIPGLIDAHTHMLAVINPAEYIKAAMLHGTTTIITEIQEITFPLGYRGALFFLNYLKDQPIKVFCTIPPLLTMSRSVEKNFLTLQQFHRLLKRDEVMGLGEPYWLPTIKGDKRVLEFISETSYAGKRMEGHASGARNEKLVAYFSTGITSCHESVSKEETLEKLRLGVSTMVREGGNRTELPAIADIQKEKIDLRLLSLVSDGLSAEILYKKGYMDHIVRQAIRYGFNPVTAIQAATINPATHFALDDILGGIAPGRYADILVVPDIENIDAEYVISKGKVVADKGHLTAEPRKTNWPVFIRRSILMPKLFTPEDFRIKAKIQNG